MTVGSILMLISSFFWPTLARKYNEQKCIKSDTVFRQIIQTLVKREKDIVKIYKIRIDKYGEGMSIYMESTIKYGCNIDECFKKFQSKIKKEIERLTSMNVQKIEIVVKSITVEE